MLLHKTKGKSSLVVVVIGIVTMSAWFIWFLGVLSGEPTARTISGQYDATIYVEDQTQSQQLPLPYVYKTQGLPPDATVVVKVPVDLPDGAQQLGVFAERPLRSLMFAWDGVPIGSIGSFEEGVHLGGGNQSLLVAIPDSTAREGPHTLEVWSRGGLGNGGIEGQILIGNYHELRRHQDNKRFMEIFLVAMLSFGSILNLAVATFRRLRFEFLSLGLLFGFLSLFMLSKSDDWYLIFSSMDHKILVRHSFASFSCCIGMLMSAIIANQRHSKAIPWGLAGGFLLGGAILVVPSQIPWLTEFNKVLFLFVSFLSLKWILQSALKGNWDARFLLLVALLLIVVSMLDWPAQWGLPTGTSAFYLPAWFIFTIGICSVLIIRFTLLADRYEHLVTQASDAIIVVMANGQVREANPAAETVFGRDPVGSRLVDLVSADDHEVLIGHLAVTDEPNREEFRLAESGSMIHLESRISGLSRRENLMIIRDISSRKEIERNLLK